MIRATTRPNKDQGPELTSTLDATHLDLIQMTERLVVQVDSWPLELTDRMRCKSRKEFSSLLRLSLMDAHDLLRSQGCESPSGIAEDRSLDGPSLMVWQPIRSKWTQAITLGRKKILALENDQRQFQQELQALDDEAGSAPPKNARRSEPKWDKAKRRFSDLVAELEDELTVENDRLLQPLGSTYQMIRETVSRIEIGDLERLAGNRRIRLKLASRKISSLHQRIVASIRGQLQTDLDCVAERFEGMRFDFRAQLSGDAMAMPEFHPPTVDFDRFWQRMENWIFLGHESEIELERKSIFDLMGAGRQKVFFLIMFVALLGRMGIDEEFLLRFVSDPVTARVILGWLSTGFMALLLSTCVGAMLNATLLWGEENEELAKKEVVRNRESLLASAIRVFEQTNKEKKTVFKAYLRSVEGAFDEWLLQCQTYAQQQEQLEKGHRESARRSLLARMNQWKEVATNWQTAVTELQRINDVCGNFLEKPPLPSHSIPDSMSDSHQGSTKPTPDLLNNLDIKTVAHRSDKVTSKFAQRRLDRLANVQIHGGLSNSTS